MRCARTLLLLLGWLWAGPITLLAWALFRALDTRLYVGTSRGLVLFAREDSTLARWMTARNLCAMTWGAVMLFRTPSALRFRAHEECHVRQWMLLGPLMLPLLFAPTVIRRLELHAQAFDAR